MTKPRATAEAPTVNSPGNNIRLPKRDLSILEGLAQSDHFPTVNQFMVNKVGIAIQVCESLTLPHGLGKCIPHLNRLLWQQLASDDLRRSISGQLSQPIKLTFAQEDRHRIVELSSQLRWSTGQVVVEALQAYSVLAAAEGQLNEVPDIIRISRANRIVMGQSQPETIETILGKLNVELGWIVKANLEITPDRTSVDVDVDLI